MTRGHRSAPSRFERRLPMTARLAAVDFRIVSIHMQLALLSKRATFRCPLQGLTDYRFITIATLVQASK